MFLAAVGWWGHGGRWFEAWTAAVAAWVLAWCAAGQLRDARRLEEQADELEERLRATARRAGRWYSTRSLMTTGTPAVCLLKERP